MISKNSNKKKALLFIFGVLLIIFDISYDYLMGNLNHFFGIPQILILIFAIFLCLGLIFSKPLSEIFIKLQGGITRITSVFLSIGEKIYIFEIFMFIWISFAYLLNSIRFQFPIGYAGLYQLSTDLLISNRFAVPDWIPYYGPGGIPFAYPPLGFYIAGLIQFFLKVSSTTYLRFAPPIFSLLGISAFYVLGRLITKNRFKAILATIFFSFSFEIYEYHSTAAGMVRAPALFFMMMALIGLWLIFREGSKSRWILILTGVLLGLTLLTHLSYFLFLILTAVILFFFMVKEKFLTKAIRFCIIMAIGAIISAPWWVTILKKQGFDIFLLASTTHGTMSNALKLFTKDFLNIITNLFSHGTEIALLGLVFLGIAYSIYKRNYFQFTWFVLTFLLIGESERFLILISAPLFAELIIDTFSTGNLIEGKKRKHSFWVSLMCITLVFGFIWTQFVVRILNLRPSLSPTLIQTGQWLQKNSNIEDRYLFFSTSHDASEWFPYLSKRPPAVGCWGAEWIGSYSFQRYLREQVVNCADAKSISCLERIKQENDISYKFIIVPRDNYSMTLPFDSVNVYSLVYQNEDYQIFTLANPDLGK